VVANGPDDFVAVKLNGDPMKISRIRNGWPEQMLHWQRHMRENVGRLVEGPRFHDLRHYAAHDLIDRSANVQTLQKFLGHKNLNTTQIYMDDVNVDEMREAMLQPRRTKRERHLQAV
jgi:integrase